MSAPGGDVGSAPGGVSARAGGVCSGAVCSGGWCLLLGGGGVCSGGHLLRGVCSGGCLLWGCLLPGGSAPGGVSAPGGCTWSWGGVHGQVLPPVDRHTPVNILPCPKLRLRAVKIAMGIFDDINASQVEQYVSIVTCSKIISTISLKDCRVIFQFKNLRKMKILHCQDYKPFVRK